MYFNIIITFNDLLFLLCMIPLIAIFCVMFKDWVNDKDRYR
jgi:hypothetical protein